MKMNKVTRANINRRNIFGENLLYKAAVHNDTGLVHHYIKKVEMLISQVMPVGCGYHLQLS